MAKLATWVREVDEPFFSRWFIDRPEISVHNARLEETGSGEEKSVLPEGTTGLLLTGGPDIAAEYLNQPVPDPSVIEEAQPERDRWEMAAAREAVERGLPIFAICKGMQVLNVALGGTLHLDIPGHNAAELRLNNLQKISYGSDAPAHTRFDLVNSSHHQALDQLGEGLVVEAWSPADRIIEQVRRPDLPYCFAVQYHPERHVQYAPLFNEFFDEVTKRR